MGAGDNEKIFCEFFKETYNVDLRKTKTTYGKRSDANISVDCTINEGNKKLLIEIDSGNMPKLIVGQYTLLNELCIEKNEFDILFLVIHFYKNKSGLYKSRRTIKNLDLVNKKIYKGNGLKFRVFNIEEFKEVCSNNKSYIDLIKYLFQK